MIVGLLNLYGSPALQELVTRTLTESGLLAATDTLYYANVGALHPRSAKLKNEHELFMCARQYPDAHIWSFNVKEFSKGSPTDLDWCAYELYFLVENWRQALTALEAGYDSYGVNLHSAPEPHYAGYCFWMKGKSLATPTLANPYCAFQSFTNHYCKRFPKEEYEDCDWSQAAPLSSRRLQEKLFQLPEDQRALGTLLLLLFHSKNHYEPIAFQPVTRPHVILDAPDIGGLAVCAPGIGRIDCVLREDPSLVTSWLGLGWIADFNTSEQIGRVYADLIYTTPERVEQWLPYLTGQGVIVIRGSYTGRAYSQVVGEFTLVACEPTAF